MNDDKLIKCQDSYRKMLGDRINIKMEGPIHINDYLIFPEWYYFESNDVKIDLLKKAIDKNVKLDELYEATFFEEKFTRENVK